MTQSRWKATTKEIVYDEKKLYNYGINRLSVRDYARSELATRMSRLQPDTEMVARVLDRLEEQGYLSDERRTRSILNQFEGRESVNKTKNRLYQKGLSKDLVQEVIEKKLETQNLEAIEHSQQDDMADLNAEQATALDLLERKFKEFSMNDENEENTTDPENTQKTKQKMVRFLSAKGFKYDDIKKAMAKRFSPED